jgi:CheY-like chemotaxis protein
MFNDQSILIVEDNAFLALDLSVAVEELDGIVIGPASEVAQALRLLDSRDIAAAIIDCHLPGQDVSPLTALLAERRVPFVIHASGDLPDALCADHPGVPVLRKPLRPHMVIACLLVEMSKAEGYPMYEANLG